MVRPKWKRGKREKEKSGTEAKQQRSGRKNTEKRTTACTQQRGAHSSDTDASKTAIVQRQRMMERREKLQRGGGKRGSDRERLKEGELGFRFFGNSELYYLGLRQLGSQV
ncbi:hypothetical protein L6164_005753 [Bauhinia variegata]|uniref:Uncharacterized protein n=1 Tax=Bauhinia variegata TaxID=167791 RepID=A0ACB9PS89_BAUVA|nr:hypothetical protein L6164_005753 [Bauhinia variegata]